MNQYQEDGSELQAVYVPGEELHIKKVWKQLRDTLIRQVAGPLERILNRLIHQRNGLMWSNPRGSIGEAAAIRPRSLRQVLTERLWPSLKRAKHALKMEIRAGARRACIWTESKWTPKNKVCREVVRTLFLVFVLRPRARMWLCDNSLSPWIGPVWANRTGSWVHKCPGASKGPEQHPCTLWTSSGLRPGQAKGKNFVLVRLSSKGKLKEFPVPPDDLNGKIGISRSTVTNQSSTWTWDIIVFNVNILNFPL